MARIRLACVALFLAIAAGCTEVVTGTGSMDTRPQPPLTSAAALGDIATVDFCSLVDRAVIDKVSGVAEIDVSMDRCQVTVSKNGVPMVLVVGEPMDGETRDSMPTSPHQVADLPAGITVAKFEEEDMCGREIVFADQMRLRVNVALAEPDGRNLEYRTRHMCEVADAALETALKMVRGGTALHFEYGDRSYSTLAACDMIPASAVAIALDAQRVSTKRYPTGHECEWDRDSARALFAFMLRPLSLDVPPDAIEETIAGRRSYVLPDGLTIGSGCEVFTVNLRGPRPGLTEGAAVYVELFEPGQDDRACTIARGLAGAAFAKLPPV
ncbi:hypothetical protein EV193_11299 [Herbihabitans rhizosphaerae]|uniref:DUF3558 domain-containing protein n=2 Tax=Herbihabitans rhizosphaerae TaxID=1872711 RepID=A0A4Q7KE05_9PSEU|nr:hypothetical protein EV193_11299 [Herbihabitans rhizosphaerae]